MKVTHRVELVSSTLHSETACRLLALVKAGPPQKLCAAAKSARRASAVGGLQSRWVTELPGTDPRKIAVAMSLWQGTTASQAWIAEHLHMKSAANVSQILRRQKSRQGLSKYVD